MAADRPSKVALEGLSQEELQARLLSLGTTLPLRVEVPGSPAVVFVSAQGTGADMAITTVTRSVSKSREPLSLIPSTPSSVSLLPKPSISSAEVSAASLMSSPKMFGRPWKRASASDKPQRSTSGLALEMGHVSSARMLSARSAEGRSFVSSASAGVADSAEKIPLPSSPVCTELIHLILPLMLMRALPFPR